VRPTYWFAFRFLVLVGISTPLRAQPRVTFSASLANGPDAELSSGAGTGICRHDAAGQGYWPVRGEADSVYWLAAGNFDKRQGTLAFRFRPAWTPGDTEWRALVSDDRTFHEKSENSFRLWKWDDKVIRFDLRSADDRYVTFPSARLTPGEWHHLAVTWDSSRGTRLYLDGQRMAAADFPSPPMPARWLILGQAENMKPGLGDYRDLLVLDQLLEDEQVAQLAAGNLKPAPAPKLKPTVRLPQPATESKPPRPVFHLSFDGTLNADLSAADGKPRRAEGVTFVDSPFGKAAYFGEQSLLEYTGEANLPHDRGALSLWVRPDWTAANAAGDRFFFREAPPDRPGDDCRWIWFHKDHSRLRFDLRIPDDPYVYGSVDGWRPGTWHHVALTWDAAAGRVAQFVDGRPLQSVRDNAKVFLRDPWTPRPKSHFWVGSRDGQAAALAAIDELTIYDGALSEAAVVAECSRVAPLQVELPTPYLEAGGAPKLAAMVTNRSTEAIRGEVVAMVTRPNGDGVQKVTLPGLALAPGKPTPVELPLPEAAAGDYLVEVAPAGKQPGPAASFRLCGPLPPRATQPVEKLVATIDLAGALPDDQFCDTGDTRLVESPLGRYREAADKRGSRFAVRLRFDHLGAWHRVEWTWPDDKPRTADVVLNRSQFDVATGTLAGDEYPNTNRMRTQSAYFWPRAQDDALLFMTAETGRPAAAAAVKVYELSGPPAALTGPPPRFRDASPRRVGLYYEDPVLSMNFGGQPSFPSFAEVVDRLVAYLEACGLNTFYYPAVWYHGPLYPSPSQGDSQLGSRPHPHDFLAYLLRCFEARGIQLVVTFNVHDLRCLAEVETDEDRVRAGVSTPLTVLWNSGLKRTGWHGTEGDFNPLDPRVHEAVRELVGELAARYGDSPAFGGVCLHLPRHSLLWFGSADTGYNDENLRGFERDTGVALDIDYAEPLRANRAYRVLMGKHQQRWLDWRCQRIAKQWREYADLLRRARSDLALTANLYTVLDESNRHPDTAPEEVDYANEARECGADVRELAKIPNVRFMNTFSPGLYRWERSRRSPATPTQRAIRAANFSPSAYDPFAAQGRPFGVHFHDKYWEDDLGQRAGLEGLRKWGQPEMGWRVSTPVPPSPHGLENCAAALGAADVQTVTKGGFVVGTVGLEDQVAPWAAAFRQLPAVAFGDVPGLADPVRVRTCHRADGEWAYAQNRLYEPVELTLRIEGGGDLTNLATGEGVPVKEGRASLRLSGYQLVALWARAGQARTVGGEARGTAAVSRRLTENVGRLRAALPKAAPDLAERVKARLELTENLLREGLLARAGHVLEEPWTGELEP
jgi:sugar phosphate isomerase/epimerase